MSFAGLASAAAIDPRRAPVHTWMALFVLMVIGSIGVPPDAYAAKPRAPECKLAAPLPQSTCTKDAQCCGGLVCGPAIGAVPPSTTEHGNCQPGCRIGGAFVPPNALNPSNECEFCDPSVTTTAWTPVAAGVACTDDGNPCSLDQCDGRRVCAHPAGNPGVLCRASAGVCDVAEQCTGTSVDCPADAMLPATTECRAAAGVCDATENCTGTAAACPVDAKAPPGTTCRAATDVCDAVESCDGSADTCPADAKKSASTVCRAAAGSCDEAERCTGSADACPADAKKSAGSVCRVIAGACDAPEACTGSSDACPADVKQPTTYVCRGVTGACDVAETCDGGNFCPSDDFLPSGTTCRGVAGDCDVAETCDGTGAQCPADAFQPATVSCRSVAGECDVAENCSGSSAACPTDAFAGSSRTCRTATGACDAADTCDGTAATCSTDQKLADGTSCDDGDAATASDSCIGGVCRGTVTVGNQTYTPGLCGDDWCDATESHASCPADCFAACYGAEALCSRPFDSIVLAGTHNAAASTAYPWFSNAANANQSKTITEQLDDGIRHLDLDTDDCQLLESTEDVCFCHGTCRLGEVDGDELLAELKDWLDANPSEVVVVTFENRNDVSRESLEAIVRAAGLDAYAYRQLGAGDPFPYTWNNMAKRGIRLVMFTGGASNEGDILLSFGSYVEKTDFGVGLTAEWPCDEAGSVGADERYGLEHVRSGGAAGDIATSVCVNETDNIVNHARKCTWKTGKAPVFYLLDFYHVNDGSQRAANVLNGVDHIPITLTDTSDCDCNNQEDCASDDFCSVAGQASAPGVAGQCIDLEGNGSSCLDDIECASNICNVGFCRAAGSQAAGLACNDDRACSTGNCTDGTCRASCGNGDCEFGETCRSTIFDTGCCDCGMCAADPRDVCD